jgi:hypothetical protein
MILVTATQVSKRMENCGRFSSLDTIEVKEVSGKTTVVAHLS